MGKRKRVEIEVLDPPDTSNVVAPFVGYFAAGRSEAEGEGIQSFSLLRNVKRPTQHLLYGNVGGVEFKGELNSGVDGGPPPCSHALAVYDKTTGKLQLVPITGGKICRLEARPTALDYKPKQTAEELDNTTEARRARNNRLVASFGSTRRVRQLKSQEAGAVRSTHVSGAQAVEDAIAKVAQEAKEAGYTREQVLQHAAAASRVLPPHNPQATTGEEAYHFRTLMPDPIWKELKIKRLIDLSEDTDEGRDKLAEAIKKHREPAYIISRLPLLKERQNATAGGPGEPTVAAKKAAKLLSFLSALMRLHQSARKKLELDAEKGLDGLAAQLNLKAQYQSLAEPLLELFYNKSAGSTGQTTYQLPQAKRDLVLRYILVVALLLEKCHMQAAQFEALRAELKLSAQEINAQFRELGATPTAVKFNAGQGYGGLEQTPDKPVNSYTVALLPGGGAVPPGGVEMRKTLQECFPELKVRTRAKKK